MKFEYSKYTIWLLNINIIVLSIAITQDFMDFNIFPAHLESFFMAFFLSYQAIVMLLFFSSIIQEIKIIRESFQELVKNKDDV